MAGGITLDMGIYPIPFVCYFFAELPAEIKSMTLFSDLGVDEISNYMFRFPSGCLTNICTSFNLKITNEAIIYGTKRPITFPQFAARQQLTILKHNGTNDITDKINFYENRPNHVFEYQVEEVARCINNNELESKIISLEETIGIMEVMDKMCGEWGFVYPFE